MKQADFNLQTGKWVVKVLDKDFNVIDTKYVKNMKQANKDAAVVEETA